MRIPFGQPTSSIVDLYNELTEDETQKPQEMQEGVGPLYQEIPQVKPNEIQQAKDSIVGNIQKEIEQTITPPTVVKTKKSLTELAEDEEFSTRAERFLEGIESNENIFEYLRDAEYSLSAAATRSFQTGKWTKEQKEDYVYLQNEFMNSDLKGFKEHFGLVKDLAGDLLLDPLNILAAVFAIPTAGATVASRAALGAAAQQSIKAFTKSKLKKAITKETTKDFALFGAAEGMAWEGLHNYFMQDMNVDLDLIDSIDLSEVATSGLLGAGLGAGLGGAVGVGMGRRYSRLAEKEFRYANEDAVSFVGPQQRKVELEQWEVDQAAANIQDLDSEFIGPLPDSNFLEKKSFSQRLKERVKKGLPNEERKRINQLNLVMARTTGKATTEFLEYAKDSPALQNFLRKIRYDYDTKLITQGERSVKKAVLKDGEESQWSFGEFVGRQFGKYHLGLAKSLNTLYRTGWNARILKEQNDTLYSLLSDKNIGVKRGEGKVSIETLLERGEYTSQIDGKTTVYKIDSDVADAYKGVRILLDESFDEAQSMGLFKTGTTNEGGFFPRLYKHDVLSKKQDVFAQKLINAGHADPDNSVVEIDIILSDGTKGTGRPADAKTIDDEVFQLTKKYQVNSFEELAKKELDVEVSAGRKKTITELDIQNTAKELKAREIVEGMIDERYTPYELRKAGANNSLGFFQARRFSKLKDSDIAEFLETDVQQVLENYFTNMSQSQGRKKYFGNTIREFETERELIKNELMQSALKRGLDKTEARKEAENIAEGVGKMFQKVTGLETYQNSVFRNNKYARAFSDSSKLIQQMAHLPFATISSITEPIILLSRANPGDVKETARSIGRSIKSETQNNFKRLFQNFSRSSFGGLKEGKKIKGFDDLNDETWTELYQTGLALEQAVQERIEGLAGEALGNDKLRWLQQGFFKTNLLTQWTKAVQLASFTTGKRLIKQNAEQLYYGKTLVGRKLTDANKDYLTRQLNELGIDENEALKWYKGSLDKNGKYDVNKARGMNGKGEIIQDRYGNVSFNSNFYSRDYLRAANRFTKEIILNPTTAEANRPLWFSHPAAQFLVQFAGYPTAFNNTILKRFVNEGYNNPATARGKTLGTVALMMTVAHIGNEIRSGGKATIDYETGEDKPIHEIMFDAARRTGITGPFDYAYRYDSEMDRNVGNIAGLVKALGGPAVQDGVDALLYRKNFVEVAATNAPFYSAYDMIFGEGTKKNIRRIAAGRAKEKEKKFKAIKYSKGGIVTNVPNVTDEPDEMINRNTGLPFNATSEAAQDIEDRELKGQMEGLGLRKPYVVGGVAKALTKTIDNASSKRGQKLRKSYLDRKHLEKLDETVDERFVSLTMIKDLLEDKDITVTEAVDALKAGGYKQSVINKFIRPYKEIGL